MYVVCIPAVNDTISAWLHGLDPDHGKWLVNSGSHVEKGSDVFEHHYFDFYQNNFLRMIKEIAGLETEVKVRFKAPVSGKINIRDFFSGAVRRYRDYSKPPAIHDAESLRRYSPALWIKTEQEFTGAGINFYQGWFDAIESNLDWLEATLRKSSTFKNMVNSGHSEREWISLLEQEKQYMLRYQCPVFPEADFKKILER